MEHTKSPQERAAFFCSTQGRCVTRLQQKALGRSTRPIFGTPQFRRPKVLAVYQILLCVIELTGGPSLPESTTDDNHDCNQPRHLYCSPKARDTNNRVMLRHRVPLTASSGRFLTWMEERTRLWPVVVVWVGMRLRSRIGMLRCRRG